MCFQSCRKFFAAIAFLIPALAASFINTTANAGDPFAEFFGGASNRRSDPSTLPYAADVSVPSYGNTAVYDHLPGYGDAPARERHLRRTSIFHRVHHRRSSEEGKAAFCVRTCDGRYFPVVAAEGKSQAASCNNFCPASETQVFRGSSIDSASGENGKSYSELPNAFRYRKELVGGCTCNGKDQFGLATMPIEGDTTIRKGDIIAGNDGLMVVGRRNSHSASLNFTPASKSIQKQFERMPVVASQ
jgi:hypothetical protein